MSPRTKTNVRTIVSKNANQQAIGIIDSGVGGLSIAKAIEHALPHEHLVYIADSKYAPYGDKTTAQINERVSSLINVLKEKAVKALVIACNTATVNLIAQLRELHQLPIIGVEPGIKPASEQTKSNKIGVLATEGTINSSAFKEFVQRFAEHNELILTACPKFVPLIERDLIGTEQAKAAVEEYVSPLIDQGCDQIVLGCTHYPFLKQDIQLVAKANVQIVDTSQAVAKQVKNVLLANQLLNQQTAPGNVEFYTTGSLHLANSLFTNLWQKNVEVLPLST